VIDPQVPEYVTRNWMSLRWSAWMPLMAAHPLALAQLPSPPGVYRVRRTGALELEWIGSAVRGVRETVERLSRQVHLPVPPYDDPEAPARLLWVGRVDGRAFEVSGAATPDDPEVWRERLRAAYGKQPS
jgi:hypothetical protein